MKNILSVALIAVASLGVVAAAPYSQDQQNGQPAAHRFNPRHRVEMLTQKLGLTADQQKELLPVIEDQRAQVRAIFKDSSLSQQDRRAKIGAVRQAGNAKIEALLTPDQKQTWEQMRQQMRARRSAESRATSNQ